MIELRTIADIFKLPPEHWAEFVIDLQRGYVQFAATNNLLIADGLPPMTMHAFEFTPDGKGELSLNLTPTDKAGQ